jgi:Tol biopolymer transport system component
VSSMTSSPIVVATLMVLTLTIVGVAAFPMSAQAPGEIAYLDGEGRVWLTDADGSERSQITNRGGFTTIAWAPDGQKLALVEGGPLWDELKSVYIVRADGSGLTKVGDGYAPDWSSDSRRISYVTNFTTSEEGSEQELRIFDSEDGSDRVVAKRRWVSGLWPIESVSYSPDDGLIAVYVAGLQMEGQLVIVDGAGSTIWQAPDLIYSADSFAWSPDGQYIAYRDSGEPFMGGEEPSLKIVGVRTREVVASLPEAGFWPRWSPDGEKIAAFLWHEGGAFQVMIVDAQSGELLYRSDQVFGDIWHSRPSWSPDDSRLLLSSSEEGGGDVLVMDEDGTFGSIATGQYPEAAWSPDGIQVALTLGEQESSEVFVVKADGSDLHKVADGWMPRWRPQAAPEPSTRAVCGLPILGSSTALGLVLAGIWASWRGGDRREKGWHPFAELVAGVRS